MTPNVLRHCCQGATVTTFGIISFQSDRQPKFLPSYGWSSTEALEKGVQIDWTDQMTCQDSNGNNLHLTYQDSTRSNSELPIDQGLTVFAGVFLEFPARP